MRTFLDTIDIREWPIDNNDDLENVIRSLNLHRNEYNKHQRASYAVRYLVPALKNEAKQRMLNGKSIPAELIPEGKKGNANYLAALQVGTNEKYVQQACRIAERNETFLDFIIQKQMTIPEGMDFIKMDNTKRGLIYDEMKKGKTFRDAILIIENIGNTPKIEDNSRERNTSKAAINKSEEVSIKISPDDTGMDASYFYRAPILIPDFPGCNELVHNINLLIREYGIKNDNCPNEVWIVENAGNLSEAYKGFLETTKPKPYLV